MTVFRDILGLALVVLVLIIGVLGIIGVRVTNGRVGFIVVRLGVVYGDILGLKVFWVLWVGFGVFEVVIGFIVVGLWGGLE